MRNLIAKVAGAAAVFAGLGLAQQLTLDLVSEGSVRQRLEAGVVKHQERQATIRQMFADAGCVTEQDPVDKKSGNEICTLPGETDSRVVVGGHFDFAERGDGIIDDWSGTSLLPSLYQALKGSPRKHTFVFVAFAAEERGLVGSDHYVRKMPREKKTITRAFVNLECLGLSPTKVWAHRSSPELMTRLAAVAKAIDIAPVEGMNVDGVGDDDTHSFLYAKIPVISIHSITPDTFRLLHSPKDRVDAIHLDEYYDSYKLVAFYLAYLDQKLD